MKVWRSSNRLTGHVWCFEYRGDHVIEYSDTGELHSRDRHNLVSIDRMRSLVEGNPGDWEGFPEEWLTEVITVDTN